MPDPPRRSDAAVPPAGADAALVPAAIRGARRDPRAPAGGPRRALDPGRRLLVGLGLAALLAAPARAIFQKTQMDRVDTEALFDSRYFLSLLSFTDPLVWQDQWRRGGDGYRIDAASLDCCTLFLQQEVRFQRPLTNGLAFKYHLWQSQDEDFQEFHQWLELERSLGGGFSAALFGEPTYRKQDSDIGLGLAYRRGGWTLSARRYLVDFDYNRRRAGRSSYERSPATDRLLAERAAAVGTLGASLEVDHPTRLDLPDDGRQFSYRRTTLVAYWRQELADGWSRRASYQYQFQDKADRFAPGYAGTSEDARRRTHELRAALEGPLSARDRLELGQVLLRRAARVEYADSPGASVDYKRWEVQPYARWRRRALPRLETELAAFLSFGEDRRVEIPGPSASDAALAQAKAGTGAEILFGASGRLQLYATWDLDVPSHPWGGGNVRALFLF